MKQRARPRTALRRDKPLTIMAVDTDAQRALEYAENLFRRGRRVKVVERTVSALGVSIRVYVVVAEIVNQP